MITKIGHFGFPMSPNNPSSLSAVEIRQGEYLHDFGVFTFQNDYVSVEGFKEGSPVYLVFGDSQVHDTFFGYVRYSQPELTSNQTMMKVFAVGASMVFSNSGTGAWSDVTAEMVIKDIARAQRFVVVADEMPRLYRTLNQTGETDWEFMCRLAKENGCSLRADKTTLYVRNRVLEASRRRENAHVLQYFRVGGGGNAYEFTPKVGDASEALRTRVVSGVDPRTGEEFSYGTTGTPAIYTRQGRPQPLLSASGVPFVAHNLTEAAALVDGAAERNRWVYTATVRCLGSARLKPGGMVFLRGDVGDYGGYWSIIDAKHLSDNGAYFAELTIGTDALGVPNAKVGSPHRRQHRLINPETIAAARIPATTLRSRTREFRPKDHIPFVNGDHRWVAVHDIPPSRERTESVEYMQYLAARSS